MLKEWFPRHQRSINWVRSSHGADCSKYVRESQWRRVCGLSWWLVLPAARKWRERMCALSCWLACPARKAGVEEGKRMLPRLFIVARGSEPGRMAWNILIGRKYEFGNKTVKIFLRQTIIWNFFLQQNVTVKYLSRYTKETPICTNLFIFSFLLLC